LAASKTTGENRPSEAELCSDLSSDVIEACQRGSRDAQERVYAWGHRRVYALIVRMVGRQDAADVTQQAFIQLFRRINTFKGQASFGTWLWRLAANEALQHLRRERQRHRQMRTLEPTSPRRAETKMIEDKELLERALERLEPELRCLFLLREVEGMSYNELAEVLDLSSGTVASRLNRARRELKKHLLDLGWNA
jgi:RNA polymerase sigma-70 factor (ECF subfamily)